VNGKLLVAIVTLSVVIASVGSWALHYYVSPSVREQNVSSSSFNVSSRETSLGSSSSKVSGNWSNHLIFLYNTWGSFTVLGSYEGDSAYSVGEAYTPDATIFLSPFIWNMKSAAGYVNMTYHGSTLRVNISMTNFHRISPNINVDGYPGVMYGQEYWFPFVGSTFQSFLLDLPAKVESLPQTQSQLSYSLWSYRGSIDDFSYDIWLTQDPNTTHLSFPDVEIMIWLYHQEQVTSSYFVPVGSFVVTGIVNGTSKSLDFSVYVLPHTGNSNGWIGVYYVSQQQLEGNVTLPLTKMIQASFPFMKNVFNNISEAPYYLNAIQVGMEFNNDSTGAAIMGYYLYNWTIEVQ